MGSTARREQIQRIIADHDPYAALIGLFTREIALRTDGWEFGAAAYARAQQELIEGGFRTVDLFTTEDGSYEDEEEFLICALDTIQWTSVVIARSGWETDETSTFLVFVAQRLGKPIYHYDTLEPLETDFTLSVGSDFDEDEDEGPSTLLSGLATTVEEAKEELRTLHNDIARECVQNPLYTEGCIALFRENFGLEEEPEVEIEEAVEMFPTTEDGTLNVLAEASRCVFSDRQETYGHPYDHHTITAGLLNALFRSKLKRKARFEAYDIWKILNCDKLARIQSGGYHVDGHTDIAGYAQVGVMVHERAEEEGT